MAVTLKKQAFYIRDGQEYTDPGIFISDVPAEVEAVGEQQKALVTAEGTTQVENVQTKGQEVLESIPQDYTELSDDVDDLKSAIQPIDNAVRLNESVATTLLGTGFIGENGVYTSSPYWQIHKIYVSENDIYDITSYFNNILSSSIAKAMYSILDTDATANNYTTITSDHVLAVGGIHGGSYGAIDFGYQTEQNVVIPSGAVCMLLMCTNTDVENKISVKNRNYISSENLLTAVNDAEGTLSDLTEKTTNNIVAYRTGDNLFDIQLYKGRAYKYTNNTTDTVNLFLKLSDGTFEKVTTGVNAGSYITFVCNYDNVVGIRSYFVAMGTCVLESVDDGVFSAINNVRSIYTVGANQEYTTIQEAVNSVPDGSTVIIYPGIYNEAVDVRATNKYLHLIGSGADKTILTYGGGDYYYPPMEISKGLVENMSFITTATESDPGASQPAHCVHIDYDGETNDALQFINCNFESKIRPCVGIGLRENFTLNFTNCKFKSGTYPIYCHEQQANNKTGQRIELIDCSIERTTSGEAIQLQESVAYSGNEMTILFQRCIAKANGTIGNSIIKGVLYPSDSGEPSGSGYLNLTGWVLDPMSALNNSTILDA